MGKQNGALIKEKRTAAGMSQEALAKAAGGVTAKDISQVERGKKDLSPEKLEAVAKALDVTPESLLVTADGPLSEAEKELLVLYRSADVDTKQAAISALKGEKSQEPDPMAMFSGMMGGGQGGEGGNPMAAMMGMMGGGQGGDNPMAGMMGMFGGGAAGGEQNEAPAEEKKEE